MTEIGNPEPPKLLPAETSGYLYLKGLPQPPPVNLLTRGEMMKLRPGILADNLKPNEVLNTPIIDDLIVFGQGPVIDAATSLKYSDVKGDKAPDLVSWAETVLRAAGELYKAGVCKRLVLSGGASGGGDTSEAMLMRNILVKEYGVSNDAIVLENNSTNTMENLIHTVNMIDEQNAKGSKEHKRIGFLASDFQLGRIRIIADLMGLDTRCAFSAEEVFRLIGERTNNQNLLHTLDTMLDWDRDLSLSGSRLGEAIQLRDHPELFADRNEIPIKEYVQKVNNGYNPQSGVRTSSYYEKMPGEKGKIERQGIRARVSDDTLYGLGLLGFAEYGMGDFYQLNDIRLKYFIDRTALEAPQLLQELGVNPDDAPGVIREKLKPYSKKEGTLRKAPPQWWRKVVFPANAISLEIARAEKDNDAVYLSELRKLQLAVDRLEKIREKEDLMRMFADQRRKGI